MDSNFSLMQEQPKSSPIKPFETAKDRLSKFQQSTETTQIKTDEEYQSIASVLIDVKKFRTEWDTFMKPIRKATKDAHAVACKQFNEINDPLEAIVDRIEPLLLDYETRRDKKTAEEENRINAEIEAQRDPNDKDVPLSVTLPKITPPSGLARRSTWKAEVKDFQALVLAVAAGEVPIAYLKADETVLNLQARALKGEMKIPGVVAVEEISYASKGV